MHLGLPFQAVNITWHCGLADENYIPSGKKKKEEMNVEKSHKSTHVCPMFLVKPERTSLYLIDICDFLKKPLLT